MINSEHINILGSLIDSTFGRSSIRDSGYGVKAFLAGTTGSEEELNPVLEIKFETIVNFNPRHGMKDQRKDLDKTSIKMIGDKINEIKKEFKILSGQSLKCKELPAAEPTVDHISHNVSLVRARYSRIINYEFYV
tara:strand:- start:1187 stop:1591 length:405 start_codon:yes stop_codon:yes gene_type:complete